MVRLKETLMAQQKALPIDSWMAVLLVSVMVQPKEWPTEPLVSHVTAEGTLRMDYWTAVLLVSVMVRPFSLARDLFSRI